jgi:hypothetical protein
MFREHLITRCVSVRRAVSLLGFGLALLLSFPSFAPAQRAPLMGSFGFLVNQWHAGGSHGAAVLGVMNLDGAGHLTGTYTLEVGGQPAQTMTGKLNGTYSSNPDGTGTLSTALDMGVTVTFAMAITDGGQALQLVATSCTGCNGGSDGNGGSSNGGGGGSSGGGGGSVISGNARALSPALPSGSYGFQFTKSPSPEGIVGVINFDGAGNLTGSFTDVSGNDSNQPLVTGTFTGTYTPNPDGTGTMNIAVDPSTTVTLAAVSTDSGSGMLLLQTAGTENSVMFGTARMQ